MKPISKKHQNLLMSLAILTCVFLAAGFSFAESDTTTNSDKPQRQRQFQGEGRGPGQGQGQGEGRGQGMGGPLRGIIEALNLTEDQKPKVQEVLKKHQEQMEAFREKHGDEMEQFRKDLREAMENKDYAKMHTLVDQFKAIDQDRPTLKALADDLRSILTAEQQATLDKKIEEMKANGPGKHMRRGGDGEGQGQGFGERPRRRQGQGQDNPE